MKLKISRNNQVGSVTLKGKDFLVVVYKPISYGSVTEPCHVRISGNASVSISENATVQRFVEHFEVANVYTPPANPDAVSPRSRPSAKKRGSK